jgi:hypothetical protein
VIEINKIHKVVKSLFLHELCYILIDFLSKTEFLSEILRVMDAKSKIYFWLVLIKIAIFSQKGGSLNDDSRN